MMNDIKIGVKMLRYAYGLKTNLVQGGIFLMLGIFYSIQGSMGNHFRGNLVFFGGLFLSCIGMLPVQMVYSLSMSDLVRTSPARKRMQTSVPVLLHCSATFLIYLAECLLCVIRGLWKPELAENMGRDILGIALITAFMMLYLGICYKYFIAATLVVVPCLCLWGVGGLEAGVIIDNLFGGRELPFWTAALEGAGILALGGAAEYLLTLLFYRAPLSKMAQPAPMRKWI